MAKAIRGRDLPMYFRGKRQSEEFARGAWAASDLVAQLHTYDTTKWSTEDVTAALADKFTRNAARGGNYSRGFVTAMVQCLAIEHFVGSPNFDVWRPLRMDLQFTSRGAAPTTGSKLYELDGAGVSVAPDLTVYVWHDDGEQQIARSAHFLARVQKRGRPISQREFTALRTKPKGATEARAPRRPAVSTQAEAANG